jgi:hypothetical protein
LTVGLQRTYARVTWLFLRLLGVVYLVAFLSFASQVRGLIGSMGLLPASPYLGDLAAITGSERFWLYPTVAWLGASDAALMALCLAGAALSAVLVVGILPAVVLPFLWLAYLSLVVVSRDFLSYQWDTLLLESGFLAVSLAPLTVRERWSHPIDPPRVAVLLMRWLVFRLMMASGVAKLASGDPTWHNLDALAFHFETQPLPTPLAWYIHQLPLAVLKGCTLFTLAIEILAPMLMFGPRRFRQVGFAALVTLQGLIALTGNYAFFNLLRLALCLFLLDDSMLGNARALQASSRPIVVARRVIGAAIAIVTIPVSMVMFAASFGIEPRGTAWIRPLTNLVRPFRSVNAYGLFTVMTTARPEIVLEGTEDGDRWIEYEFKHKPGAVHRRPSWVAPHQPRLDWQMWFAAIGRPEEEPWLHVLCERLLAADSDVLALLDHDPFHGRTPRRIRAVLFDYRFSDGATSGRDGAWWVRQRREILFAIGPT